MYFLYPLCQINEIIQSISHTTTTQDSPQLINIYQTTPPHHKTTIYYHHHTTKPITTTTTPVTITTTPQSPPQLTCSNGVSTTSRSFSICSLQPPTSEYVTSGFSSTCIMVTEGSILGGSGMWIWYLLRSTLRG